MKTKRYKCLDEDTFWNDLKSGKFASMVKESSKGKALTTSKEVYNILKPLFAKEDDVEQFYVIFLDSVNQIIDIDKIFSGSLNCTLVHSREIIKLVLAKKALSIIVAHNHPSGCTKASKTDFEVTQKLKQAMEVIGGKLLDHVIIGNGYYSIADNGWS